MVFRSECVDAANHFGDGRHVPGDEVDGLLLQGSHALLLGQAAKFVLRRPADDEPLDLGRHLQEFVDADAVLVPGLPAEVAASAVAELRLGLTSALLVERGTTMKRRATSSGTKAIASGSGLSLRRSTTGILKTSPSTSAKSR